MRLEKEVQEEIYNRADGVSPGDVYVKHHPSYKKGSTRYKDIFDEVFPTRMANAFRKYGYRTIEEIYHDLDTNWYVEDMRNIGEKSLKFLKENRDKLLSKEIK